MDKEKEIKRIKEALIGFDPAYFTMALCLHEPEEIKYQKDFDGKLTGGMRFDPYWRCKKCGLMLDRSGSSIVERA